MISLLKTRIKTSLGIGTALALAGIFIVPAQASSSWYSYEGTYIDGATNGVFHTLAPGSAYLNVYSYYGKASVQLVKQRTYWYDRSYGYVTVDGYQKYKFPDTISSTSSSFYLIVQSMISGNVSGDGYLQN